MDIEEMHVTSRELAQQMGIQTVRAILVENIDICLNAAISQITKELVNASVSTVAYNDKVARNNVGIAPINALRTLVRKANVQQQDISGAGTEVSPYLVDIDSADVMLYTSFKVSYDGNSLYDCRIIEHEDLGQTLRDFCNRAAKETPVCTIVGDESKIQVSVITGRNTKPRPQYIHYTYLKNPAIVHYDEENATLNVNCDLPEYLHMDVVQRGVSIYLQSIGAVRSSSKDKD